ncbi:sigma-70 family RNA polymerase sigma factor [Brevundimonas naejangsanensis]|uniref:sigma-70 family RNA polymerase sigma factor n=1 Tax=Brevundimonas naejangsanensis TaxID=588932 RepID=UPI003D330205
MSASPPQSSKEDRERRVLARAIRRLPRRCRDVFVLHRFAGMPLEQIAEHLGIEKRVVETRLAAALVRLSRAFDDADGRGAFERS